MVVELPPIEPLPLGEVVLGELGLGDVVLDELLPLGRLLEPLELPLIPEELLPEAPADLLK